VNILAGHIEPIGSRPFGTLVIAVPGDVVTSNAVAAALLRLELSSELLGYVA
jgi:D-methionine transport system ATP-binding protein